MESNPDIVIFNVGCSDERSFNWNEDNFLDNFKIFVGTFKNLVLDPKVYLLAPPETKSDDRAAMKNMYKNTMLFPLVADYLNIGEDQIIHLSDAESIENVIFKRLLANGDVKDEAVMVMDAELNELKKEEQAIANTLEDWKDVEDEYIAVN